MPTLRERFDAGIEAGVDPEEMGKRFRELGLTQKELDLDYSQAVKIGKQRLATKEAKIRADLEKSLPFMGGQPEVPFKAPQMDVEALGKLKVGGTPPVIEKPATEPRKGKEKVVVPLAQELVGAFIPQEAFPFLPEAIVPETKETEKDLRLEIGPSLEKIGLGLVSGAKEVGLAGTEALGKVGLIPESVVKDSVDFFGPSKTVEAIKSFSSEVEKLGKEAEAKPVVARVGDFAGAVGKGTKDLVLGLADMVNYYAGISAREGITREEEAQAKGQEVVAGMLGISAGAVKSIVDGNLGDLIETKPVETFVGLLPLYSGAKKLSANIPGVSKITTALKENASAFAERATPKAVSEVAQKATEGFATAEPMSSAIAEQMFKGAEAAKASIKEAGKRAAEEVPKTKAELVEEAKGPRETPTRIAAKEAEALEAQAEGLFLDDMFSPEEVLRVSSPESGLRDIDVKSKYLKDISEGVGNTFEAALSEAPEVAPVVEKAKSLISKKEQLTEAGLDFERANRELIQPFSGYTNFIDTAVQTYKRMLAENVDSPTGALRDFIDKEIAIKMGSDRPNVSFQNAVRSLNEPAAELEVFKKDLGDYVKNLVGQDLLQQGIADLLTDSITPPAATVESYMLDPVTGKLAKGTEAQKRVLRRISEEKRPPMGEFERQALEQRTAKEVKVAPQATFGLERRPAIKIKTTNPEFDKAVFDLAREVIDTYPQEAKVKITPERIASRFNAAVLENTLNNLNILRTENIRKAVLSDVKKILEDRGLSGDVLRRTIRDLDKDVLRPAATENNMAKVRSFEIKNKAGDVILDGEALLQSIASAEPKVIEQARRQTVLDLAEDIATETEYFKIREGIRKESLRFMTDAKGKVNPRFIRNPEVYVTSLLEQVILNNQPKPVFVPFEGLKLANIIRSNLEKITDIISKRNDLDVPQTENLKQRMLEEADRFAEMEKFDTAAVDTMAPDKATQYTSVIPENQVFENLYAPKQVADAFKWELASRQALQNPNFGLGIFQAAKRNLVARSLASLKNNNLSNYFALSIKTGNPFIFADIIKDGFIDFFITPKKDLPLKKQQAYRAIEASGLLDTTEIARDIGDFKSSPLGRDTVKFFRGEEAAKAFESTRTYDVLQKFNRGFETANKALESAYTKAGDVPFKVQQAYSAFNRITDSVEQLSPGFKIESPISANARLRLTKDSKGNVVAQIVNNKGAILPNSPVITGPLTNQRIQNLIGRAAAYESNKLFFDYGDVGTYAKMLRSYPVLNAVSGFYTWYLKSLDIPFVKRGMVANTLFPSEFIISNDPKVIASNLDKAFKQNARRALITNAMLGNISRMEGNEEQKRAVELAKKAIAFAPKDAGTILLGPLGDVSQLYYNDFSATVPYKATDLLFKVGADVLAKAIGFGTAQDFDKKLFPLYQSLEEREKGSEALKKEREALKYFMKDLRGENYSAKDVLSLVGLGGNAIFNFLDKIGSSEEQGKVFNTADVLNEFMGTAIGRTAWSLISNAIGGAGVALGAPEKPGEGGIAESMRALSPYAREQKKYGFLSGQVAPDVNNFTLYALSQIMGSGWRKVNLLDEKENVVSGNIAKSRFEQYLTGVEKELRAKLVRPLEDRAKQYRALADNEDDPDRKQSLEESFKFYQDNIEAVKEMITELLDQDRQIINKVLKPF